MKQARAGLEALVETDLALPGMKRGKVRDTYRLPGSGSEPGHMLIVATDRLSAFDVVLPTPIPGKGRILAAMSAWWMRFIEDRGLARTHTVSHEAGEIPESAFRPGGTPRAMLEGRVTIAHACRVIPVECVVRGYLEGSGLKEYNAKGTVSGLRLPAGLVQCDKLPEPIFTPSTKAEPPAHDEAITFEKACAAVGRHEMEYLRNTSLLIYKHAAEHALARGIIIADTKFEFGLPIRPSGEPTGELPILIDEALTPDSSRFWDAGAYQPGHAQPSYDKQFVREYLESLVARGEWNKSPPGPQLPAEIVEKTREKYARALELLTA